MKIILTIFLILLLNLTVTVGNDYQLRSDANPEITIGNISGFNYNGKENLANPQADGQTKCIYDILSSLPYLRRMGLKTLSGQMLNSFFTPVQAFDSVVKKTFEKTGKWVGLIGVDYCQSYPRAISNMYSLNNILFSYFKLGGLVTVMASFNNPWTGRTMNDTTGSWNLGELISNGTNANKNWLKDLDSVAIGLKQLQDSGVTVLFRPFHEMNAPWFWWGSKFQTVLPDAFVSVWKYMFQYLTDVKKLNNLIWVFSPSAKSSNVTNPVFKDELFFFPGNEFADIIGLDIYEDTLDIPNYDNILSTGLPVAIAEFGCGRQKSAVRGSFDYTILINQIKSKYSSLIYWMSWNDFTKDNGSTWTYYSLSGQGNSKETLEDLWVINRGNIDWLAQCQTEPPQKVNLEFPLNGDTIYLNNVNLLWYKLPAGITNYHIQVSTDRMFRSIFINDSAINDTNKFITNLEPDNTFFWRVRARNNFGWGEYSDIWSFTVLDTTTQPESAIINVNFNKQFQIIEGWGASSNFYEEVLTRLPQTVRDSLFNLLFTELGANILCIRLYSDFQRTQGGAYNWDIMANQRMITGEALKRGKINYIWLKISSPPGWMKDNGSADSGGRVKTQHYKDYADYLSYYIRKMKTDYNIEINGVSIFNEPGFSANYESTTTTSRDYTEILKVVASTFKQDGIENIDLIGPESGHINGEEAYFTSLMSDPVSEAALKKFTVHQYGDYLLLYGTGQAGNWEWLRDLAALHNKPVWETEVFIGGPNLATNDIDEALRMALFWWTAISKGNVSAWHYWQYYFPEDMRNKTSQGLITINIDRTFSVYPRFHAFRHWSSCIRQGSSRIEAICDNKNLYSAAFSTGDSIILVVFNRTDNEIPLTVFSGLITSNSISHIRTSATENFSDAGRIIPGNASFSSIIKAKSINTFIYEISAGSTEQNRSVAQKSPTISFEQRLEKIFVNLNLINETDICLNIFDILGNHATEIFNGRKETGQHQFQYSTKSGNMAPGVYFCRIKTGNNHKIFKFVITN